MFKSLDVPTKVGLLLEHGSSFCQMPFLPPPMTHIGISGKWSQAHWVEVRRLKHRAVAARYIKQCYYRICLTYWNSAVLATVAQLTYHEIDQLLVNLVTDVDQLWGRHDDGISRVIGWVVGCIERSIWCWTVSQHQRQCNITNRRDWKCCIEHWGLVNHTNWWKTDSFTPSHHFPVLPFDMSFSSPAFYITPSPSARLVSVSVLTTTATKHIQL